MQPPSARNLRALVQPDAARHTFLHFPFLRPQHSQQSRRLCRNISSYCLIQSRCTNSASWFWGRQSIAVSGGAAVSALGTSTSPPTSSGLCYSGEQGYDTRVTATKRAGNVEDLPLLLIDETRVPPIVPGGSLAVRRCGFKCGCAPSVDLHLSPLGSEHGFTT
jgi:hypothetical protein